MKTHQPSPLLFLAVLLLAAFALLLAAVARAESVQRGGLIAALDGSISPRELPRSGSAPVSVELSGLLRSADGSPLPRLGQVELALGAGGVLERRGLPTCSPTELRATTPQSALALCGDALVGRGTLDLSVFIPTQPPFDFHATLRAFNGSLEGHPALWFHVYGARPPSAIVLPALLRHRRGSFPTAIAVSVPDHVGTWPHLASFELKLSRRFTHRGVRRSYLNASCPLPPAFRAGVFPFARATYTFSGGSAITTEIVRGCRAND